MATRPNFVNGTQKKKKRNAFKTTKIRTFELVKAQKVKFEKEKEEKKKNKMVDLFQNQL